MTMEPLKLPTGPHRRFNPLTGDWVLVSPHRTQRPWQGQIERQPLALAKSYDPACYLCPGNARAGGVTNPQYETTFVFDNDFAALKPLAEGGAVQAEGKLIAAEPEAGVCRVICFSPRHDLTLARMAVRDIRPVIDVWAAQTKELTSISDISYVQIFENRGEMMGCSNPHPHCQLWATHTIPNEPQKELNRQREYATTNHGCLLCDYLEMERQQGVRVICENEHFSAVVPFWAVWPYEAIVISKKHSPSLSTLEDDERRGLADVLKRLTTRYDNLFETLFPYSMGFHQCPADGNEYKEWHVHAHFYPPLLRSASVKKFMVGFELLGMPQRDITPEAAAERLRSVSEQHFLEQR